MASTQTKEQLGKQLLDYFDGDASRVKQLAQDCESLDFKLGDNLEAIAKNQEAFFTLITLSEFGFLSRLTQVLNRLKEK